MKKGQHVICKYHGNNGDTIVGRIESVRSKGNIILTNLLTGHRSTKDVYIVETRLHIVHKAVALKVVEVFQNTKDRQKARAFAVEQYRLLKRPQESVHTPVVKLLDNKSVELTGLPLFNQLKQKYGNVDDVDAFLLEACGAMIDLLKVCVENIKQNPTSL